MLVSGLVVTIIAGAAAFAATMFVLRGAARFGLVQAPNARSSHKEPTPTGGGIGIVAGGTIASAFAAYFAPWPGILVLAASLAIAAIGLLDDIKSARWDWRLAGQLVLFALVLIPLLPLDIAFGVLQLPPIVAVFVLLAAVLWINLFNFMDGIDGLAASEAAFLLLAAAALALVNIDGVTDIPMFWWPVALGAAVLGFLALNWPPARIFMGDAGSTYLGFMLAFLALATASLGWLTLWQWLILAAVFLTDGLVTLIRRQLQGERVTEAHRRHAYQILSRRFGSHRTVTLGVLAVNVIWLLPLAWAAGALSDLGWLWALTAYAPLIGLALCAGAGRREPGEV